MAGSVAGTTYSMVLYFIIYIKKKLNSFVFIMLGVITGVANVLFANIVSFEGIYSVGKYGYKCSFLKIIKYHMMNL
ncbi:hypothetical protein [Tepidimicrobium xylanilyticum]|uniref:Uncharacterized protein n=1 Tax=Tepidimicrobium xylanilyticum TaxID=1123352 RepID=A0A1H2SYP1_9FIRM|nr:hypothetical protein [Tepidimicrobium xylanilyticum]GMG96074.1 hypothetical protein EN5CB1_09000 [Tepidimicrobium xylanilyticum]SDW36627.1 hypothetical protein SAMN05660923_00583 [Tepidimicrobium xylanilyticum]